MASIQQGVILVFDAAFEYKNTKATLRKSVHGSKKKKKKEPRNVACHLGGLLGTCSSLLCSI
jgi:hypothetical protein